MVSNGFWHIVSIVKELRPPCPAEWHPNNFARIDAAARNVNTQKQKFWFFHKYPEHACKRLKAWELPTTLRDVWRQRAGYRRTLRISPPTPPAKTRLAVRRFVSQHPQIDSIAEWSPRNNFAIQSLFKKIRETKFTKTASHNLQQ